MGPSPSPTTAGPGHAELWWSGHAGLLRDQNLTRPHRYNISNPHPAPKKVSAKPSILWAQQTDHRATAPTSWAPQPAASCPSSRGTPPGSVLVQPAVPEPCPAHHHLCTKAPPSFSVPSRTGTHIRGPGSIQGASSQPCQAGTRDGIGERRHLDQVFSLQVKRLTGTRLPQNPGEDQPCLPFSAYAGYS